MICPNVIKSIYTNLSRRKLIGNVANMDFKFNHRYITEQAFQTH